MSDDRLSGLRRLRAGGLPQEPPAAENPLAALTTSQDQPAPIGIIGIFRLLAGLVRRGAGRRRGFRVRLDAKAGTLEAEYEEE